MSRHCGECNFFSHESIDGYGWCDVTQREQQCSDQCTLSRENITDKQALRVLHYAQKWRRGAKTESVNPYVSGIAICRNDYGREYRVARVEIIGTPDEKIAWYRAICQDKYGCVRINVT